MAMSTFLNGASSTTPLSNSNYAITDSGNSTMKVVVRVRPENEAEVSSSNQSVVKVVDEYVLVFDPLPDNTPTFANKPTPFKRRPFLSKKHKDLQFAFDKVFDETASQVDIFESTTQTIIEGVLDGLNCSVFAYGATGAGKTHTMLGNSENPGVMFLTMMELYRRIDEIRAEKTCDVAVSYCEVYNENIRDLLVPSGYLQLRDDGEKGLVVSGLSRHQPHSADELLNLLEIGNRNRTQHPTDANATSSRSHAVFQVFIHQKARTSGLSTEVMCAKMSLIDLAGSERATVTTNRGARLREGASINKSLLALGNCINALADNKAKAVHIPYRNSKLTRLLKDSLGGNCRTVMIANISPSGFSFEDTYNTLKYADRAKQIKTKLVRNVLNVDYHVSKYRAIVQDLQKEISELKLKLDKKSSPKKLLLSLEQHSESTRLQEAIQAAHSDRTKLRKHMAELDASEREMLLRVCRKERDVARIEVLSGNPARKAKLLSRVESLQGHVTEVQRQKQRLNDQLCANNEAIGHIQADVNTSCGGAGSGSALRQLLGSVTEAKKLETETAHQWKQTKYLLKYIKNQEREMSKTERILVCALELVRKQHSMLQACSILTPNLQDQYDGLIRMTEGEKEVAWADQNQSADNLLDVSTSSLTQSQLALFDSFVFHSSPLRRGRELRENSPLIATSLGILANVSVADSSAPGTFHQGSLKAPLTGFEAKKNQTPLQPTKNISSASKSAKNISESTSMSLRNSAHTVKTEGEKVSTNRSATTKRTKISHPLAKTKSIADVIVPPSSPQNFHANPISSGRFRKVASSSSTQVGRGKGDHKPPPQFPRPVSFQSSSSTYDTRLNTVLNSQGSHFKSNTLPRSSTQKKPNPAFKPHPLATPSNGFEDNFVSPRNPKTSDQPTTPNFGPPAPNFGPKLTPHSGGGTSPSIKQIYRPPTPNFGPPAPKLTTPHGGDSGSASPSIKHAQSKSAPEFPPQLLQEENDMRELSPLERASVHYHRLHSHLTQQQRTPSPLMMTQSSSSDVPSTIRMMDGSYPVAPSSGAAFNRKEPIKPSTPLSSMSSGNFSVTKSNRSEGGGGVLLNRSYPRNKFVNALPAAEFISTPSRSLDHSLLVSSRQIPSTPNANGGGGVTSGDGDLQLSRKKGGILNTPNHNSSFDHAALFDKLMSNAPPTSAQKRQLRIGGILNSPAPVSFPPQSRQDHHSPIFSARFGPPPFLPTSSTFQGVAPFNNGAINSHTTSISRPPNFSSSSYRPFETSKPLAMVSPALNLAKKFDKESNDSKGMAIKINEDSSQQVAVQTKGGDSESSQSVVLKLKNESSKLQDLEKAAVVVVKPAFPKSDNPLTLSTTNQPPGPPLQPPTKHVTHPTPLATTTSDSTINPPPPNSTTATAVTSSSADDVALNETSGLDGVGTGRSVSVDKIGTRSINHVQSLDLSSFAKPRFIASSTERQVSASLDRCNASVPVASVKSCDVSVVSCDAVGKSCDGGDGSLNSTFTIRSDCSTSVKSAFSLPGFYGNSKPHPQDASGLLGECENQDSAKAGGDSEADGGKKAPSYLQMTKSVASKRVLRLYNKENRQFPTAVPSNRPVLKSKKLQNTRSFLPKSSSDVTFKTVTAQSQAGQRTTFLNKSSSRVKSFLVH